MMACLLIACVAVFADNASEQKALRKQREEIRKMAKSELTAKSSKDARKSAKGYIKEGWKVNPGALPIEKQLEKSYLQKLEA